MFVKYLQHINIYYFFFFIIFFLLPVVGSNALISLSNDNPTESHKWQKMSIRGRDSLEIVMADGGIFAVAQNDSVISSLLKLFGQYERLNIKHLISLLEKVYRVDHGNEISPQIMLDVGSNLGLYSINFANHFDLTHTTYKIFAYDAQNYMTQLLAASALMNNVNEQIFITNGVVTNISGSGFTDIIALDLFDVQNFGGYSVHRPFDGDRASKMKTENKNRINKVANIVIDDMYEKGVYGACPTFLKVDIESHELFALIGSKKMLQECLPVLHIEAVCGNLLKSIILLLDSVGYSLAWLLVPLMDPSFTFANTTMFHKGCFGDKITNEEFLNAMFDGVNIVGVPRALSHLLSNKTENVFFPIKPDEGKFVLDDYGFNTCYSNTCITLKSAMCPDMHDFETNYWQSILTEKQSSLIN